jgi:hypothetical protein
LIAFAVMRLYIALAFAIFTASCGGSKKDPSVPEPPVEHFTLRSPGGFEEVALEGDRLFGPSIDVVRYDKDIRGKVREQTVDIRISETLIEGTIGNARTELHIEKLPDGFGVRGLFGGRIGQFRMQSDILEGRLGGRAFVLRRTETDPTFYRSPVGSGELTGRGSTEFKLPKSFADRPIEQQAALLALFFGR